MAKWFQILTAGVAATVIASLVGCSQAPEQAATDPSQSTSATEEAPSEAPAASAPDESKSKYRAVKDLTLPSPGPDPLAMVVQLRQPSPEASGTEQIRLSYPKPDTAVVVTTLSGMQDDSVSALRTRYVLQPVQGNSDGNKLWEIVKVTQQNKCQAGRGSQEWTGDLCQ